MGWSSAQYSKFEQERNRPIVDLLAQVPTDHPTRSAVDLGCGPGNSTELLARTFPAATITGIDSSADMITAARLRMPGTIFHQADIASWSAPMGPDLILANAALQWVPEHEKLIPHLVAQLNHGGTLAVQMPDNADEPAHVIMRELAASREWKGKLSGVAERLVRPGAAWYFDLLHEKSSLHVNIWRTTYFHRLQGGAGAIVEWFRGSGLRPYLDTLNELDRFSFLQDYESAIAPEYKTWPDGTVLLPFPRLFMVLTTR